MRLRVPLLGMDQVGELERIPNEEHRRVVTHHVPVSFLRVELDGESTGVAGRVGESRLPCHGGPSPHNWRLLSNFTQKFRFADISHITVEAKPTQVQSIVSFQKQTRRPRAEPKLQEEQNSRSNSSTDLGMKRIVILCDFEVAMSTSAFRMDNTLRDALSVEMRVLLQQVKIFKQGISTLSDCQTAMGSKHVRVSNEALKSHTL